MKDTKTSPGKTTKPELKKSDIGHAAFKALSNLGAEFEEPKLKKSDLGQKLLEAMLNIDWSNPPKVKV